MEDLLLMVLGKSIAALGGHDWMYEGVAWLLVRIEYVVGTVPILLGSDSDV